MELLQQLINGLSLGSIYALLALGYTMVYGIIQLINFAHGDIYMIGAFTGFFVATKLNLSFLPTMISWTFSEELSKSHRVCKNKYRFSSSNQHTAYNFRSLITSSSTTPVYCIQNKSW